MTTVLLYILLMSSVHYTESMRTTLQTENTTEAVGFNGRRPLYLLGLLPYSGSWPIGETAKYGYEIAIDHINQNPGILPGFELKVIWKDTKCDPGYGAQAVISELYNPPKKVMILGDSCSSVCVSVAGFTPYYNLVQLSCEAVASTLSNKELYPNFFRLWPPETSRNPLIIDTLKQFKWRKVAIITELYVTFSATTDHLIGLLEENGFTLLTSEIFQTDPLKAVKAVKAYKMGFHGPQIVWHLIGWYTLKWWSVPDPSVRCSLQEMVEATNGIVLASAAIQPLSMDVVGVSGFTSRQIDDIVHKDERAQSLMAIHERFFFYDTVWACALALNASIPRLAEIGKDLYDFSYDDDTMGEIIKSSMQDLVFQGSLGTIKFDSFGDPSINFEISYQRNGTVEHVGTYVYNSEGIGEIQWLHPGRRIQWIGRRVPSDSTQVIELPLYMSNTVFTTLTTLAALGIFLSTIFLCFNIAFRNKRMIKMSSPKINNLILLGCISVFTTVFFYEQDEQLTQVFCTVRVFVFTIGFSLVFGSLFSKTWRVHVIFASKKPKSVNIQDHQLLLIVLAIVCVNSIILITWVTVDPLQATYVKNMKRVLDSTEDVVFLYRVSVCVSAYSSVFMGLIYVIQGVMLAFGAFLAWETNKVTVEDLNDSKLIGSCIYNVLILSALGVGLDYVLSHETHLIYTLNASFMILGTFCTQCTIFLPKLVRVIRGQADVNPTTMKKELALQSSSVE